MSFINYLPISLLFCISLCSQELRFYKSQETLDKIQEIIANREKGVYLRFGDGDINLAYNEADSYQRENRSLSREMREAFALNGPTVLKTLPLYCVEFGGWEEGMFPGNHEGPYEWCLNILNRAKGLWGGEVKSVYSHAALAFTATSHPKSCLQFLHFLKAAPCTLFVGNCNTPPWIRTLFFGSSCHFIPTPASHSYSEIDRIEKECLDYLATHPGYKVVVVAMGCSGRALEKRLFNLCDELFLFDFGSLLDAICGWDTRAWIELTHFNASQFISEFSSFEKSGL
jgi:hypothetical protein